MPPSDRHLIKRIAVDGDERAFEQLVCVRYRAQVHSICRHFSDRNDFDDLVQESYTQIWVSIRKHRPTHHTDIRLLVAKITRHTCIDQHTRSRALKRWPTEKPLEIDRFDDPEAIRWPSWYLSASPEQVVIARWVLREGWAALTSYNREVLNDYLRRTAAGETMTSGERTRVCNARKSVRPLLEAEDGVNPLRKLCELCDKPLELHTRALYCAPCGVERRRQRQRDAERERYWRQAGAERVAA